MFVCEHCAWGSEADTSYYLSHLYPSGLSALSTNFIREYHYVETLKTWAEAQSYCREMFTDVQTLTDLATVENQDENDRLLSVLQGHGNYAWIGLYDDLTRWKWTLGNAAFKNDTDYSNWKTNEPDNVNSKEKCTVMTKYGFWRDYNCGIHLPAVCYYGKRISLQIFSKLFYSF